MNAQEILESGIDAMNDRAADRDVKSERTMGKCVHAFNAITGHNISERDGWLFMVLLKATRAAATPTGLPDDYIDGAAYFALAGESIG